MDNGLHSNVLTEKPLRFGTGFAEYQTWGEEYNLHAVSQV